MASGCKGGARQQRRSYGRCGRAAARQAQGGPLLRLALLLLAPLVALPSCLALVADAEEGDEEDIAQAGDATPLEIDTKLRRFTSCRDSLRAVVVPSTLLYQETVSFGGRQHHGVTPAIDPVPRSALRNCQTLLREAPAMRPPMPLLEDTTERLVAIAGQYSVMSQVLHHALDTDATARTKATRARLAALDPALRSLAAAFSVTDRVLGVRVDGEHSQNDPRLLEQLERDQGALEYRSRALIVHSRPLMRCLAGDRVALSSCGEAAILASEAYQAFLIEYERDQTGAREAFWMRSFVEDAESFHEAVLTFARRRDEDARELLTQRWDALLRAADTVDFEFP